MKTELVIFGAHFNMASQARRRWFVALLYVVVIALGFAPFSAHVNALTGWITIGCVVLFGTLFIVFTWIAGDPRIRGDEREMHRRDHAHYVAYRVLLYGWTVTVSCYFVAIPIVQYFRGSNPLFLPLTLRGSLMQVFLLMAVGVVFGSLPQAILLWTEPDMEDPQIAS